MMRTHLGPGDRRTSPSSRALRLQATAVVLALSWAACRSGPEVATAPSRPEGTSSREAPPLPDAPSRREALPLPEAPLTPCRRLPARHALAGAAPVDRGAALAHLDRGTARARAMDWAGARAAFAEAVRLDPGLGLAHLGLAETLAHLGGAAADRRAHLATALVDLPDNPRAHVRFASALVEGGDPAGGLRHLRCALTLRAELDDARRQAALLALELEGPEAAAALLSPLFAAGPKARDWVLLGEVRAAQRDLAGSAEALETAAARAGSAPFYRRAAMRWDEAGEAARADAARRRADDLDPPARRRLRPLRPARVRAP